MRQTAGVTLTLVLVTCGGAPPPVSLSVTPPVSPSATPPVSPSASVAAGATSVRGVTSTNFGTGRFHEIDAVSVAYSSNWQARISTKSESDVWMLENRIAPGGSFGWHSHPGPSLVVVKTGTLTLYQANDPDCKPQVIEAGSGFVDAGGDVHLVRNEGSIETVVYVMSLVPRGATRRIDQPNPSNCPSVR